MTTSGNKQVGSVISGWVVAIDRALEHYQLNSEEIFTKFGLNFNQTRDANSRFPVTRVSQVLLEADRQCTDENFGLLVAKYNRTTSWHALGISILSSQNMKETFERLILYKNIFFTELEVEMKTTSDICILQFSFSDAYQSLLSFIDMDAIIATFILTGRYLAQEHFKAVQVELCRPPPNCVDGFNRLFKCPINFNAEHNRIYFQSRNLLKPLLTANRDLALLSDKLTQEYLQRLEKHDIINQLYLKLSDSIGSELLSQKRMAESMFMSERTLQRRLQQAGSSYQEILDQLRIERALNYLQQRHLSINKISELLGFSKVGSFTRAFKRWKGLSPNQYRQEQK